MINRQNLTGREKEVQELEKLINHGKGLVVLISGEAGIGKTFFTEEIFRKLNIPYCTGRLVENAVLPYSPLTSIIRSYLRENGISEINFGPLTEYLSVLLPEIKSDQKDADKETLSQAVSDALIKISNGEQLIIFLDDIHWSDDATLELLPLISEKLEAAPIMIFGTYRSDEIPAGHKIRWMRNELRRRKKLREFFLFPFTFEETKQFAAGLMNNKLSNSLAETIFKKTQGVPLFIEELSETIVSNGLIELNNNEACLKSDSDIPLPESITDAVLIKVETLSHKARQILEIAAAAGEEVEINLIKGIAGTDEGLEELLLNNLLKETQPGKAEFKHTLIREAIKNIIPYARRKELNSKIAVYLYKNSYHPEIAAFHWLEANELENARMAFIESSKRSCDVQAYSDAARSASRALAIWTKGKEENERIETLLQMATCLHLCGELDKSLNVLKEIIDLPNTNNKLFARVYRLLATVYGLKSKWELVAKTRLLSAQLFEKDRQFEDAAAEYLAAAARFTSLIDLNEALLCSERAGDLSEKINNINIQSRALGLRGNITAMLGKPVEGNNIVQQGLDLALKNNLPDAASEIYRRLASTMEYQSDYISAKNAYNNAYNFCINAGSEVYAQICLGCMSYIFFQTGEWKKSLEVCADVLKNKKSPDGSRTAALATIGLIHAFRGQVKSAEKNLNQAYNLAKRIKNNIIFFSIYWGRAVIADLEDKTDKALASYIEILELWKTFEDRHDSIPMLMWGANIFSSNKKEKELITCIENLSMISNETSNTEALSALAFALGEYSLLNKRNEEAKEKFEQSLLHQEKITVPYEEMLVKARLGETFIKMNDIEKAVGHLNDAYSISKNMGARPYAARFSGLLSDIGHKIDKRISSSKFDPSSSNQLTKRQNEILRFIGDGLTNKEIADKMFLSSRTIDMHVSHILERLNCRTRTEAISKAKELKII